MIDDPYSSFDIKGKVALVVGATGAFGSVAAKTFAGAGCKVALTGGNKKELEKVSNEISSSGCENIIINVRPSSEKDCEFIVKETVNNYQRIDILVVASGINKVSKVEDMAPETFTTVMDVNVTQSWLMAREVTKQMKVQGDGSMENGSEIQTTSAENELARTTQTPLQAAAQNILSSQEDFPLI